MTITSTAFTHSDYIPSKYTCDGVNHNPPLTFSKVPVEAKSLVLIVDDLFESEDSSESERPDAPSKVFVHWVLYNIPSSTIQILENEVPLNSLQGMTDFGKLGYGGPCPPSGTHRYFFKLAALDTLLDLKEGVRKEEVEKKMKGHIIESAEIVGLYKRS